MIHPCGVAVFGLYDAARDRISLTEPETCRAMASEVPALAGLSFAEHYGALVAHEIAHRVVAANDPAARIGHLGHEYAAAIVQLAALPAPARAAFLAPGAEDAPMRTEDFSLACLMMSPHGLARHAWRHAQAAGGPCAALRGVLSGRIGFRPDGFEP